MTQEELLAKFAPRKCSSQIEFDELLQQINFEQSKMNHPLLDKERDFQNQFRNIDIQMSALRAQRNAVCIGYNNLHQEQKDINRLFYQIKQELYALNPVADHPQGKRINNWRKKRCKSWPERGGP